MNSLIPFVRCFHSSACTRLRNLTLAASVCAVVQTTPAQQALPFVDHFAYTDGANLGGTGGGNTVWNRGGAASTSLLISNTAAMSYPGLAAAGGLGVISSGVTTKARGVEYTSQSSGTVYCSFLLNIQSLPAGNRLTAFLQTGTSGGTTPSLGVFVNAAGQVGIGKASSNPNAGTLSSALATGTANLIVARYTFNPGTDDDLIEFWVNPTPLGDNGNIPSVTGSLTSGSDAATLDTFFLNASPSGGTVWLDEARVGLTWADVTPAGGGGGPTNVTLHIAKNGDGTLGLSLVGTPGAQYFAEAAPSVSPPTTWTGLPDSTNTAAGDGTWSYTATQSGPRQFYRAAQIVP